MKIVGRINNSLVAISGLFLAVSVTLCTINTLGRYLFNFYFTWADEFNIFDARLNSGHRESRMRQ